MGRRGDSVTLSEFAAYMRSDSHDDCDFPYYLVETNFEGERAVLLDDYHPPPALALCAAASSPPAGSHSRSVLS